jgi:hypothetical protein
MRDLISAYLRTDYRVFEPALSMRIGEVNEALDELLCCHHCREWAYLTAWNPLSIPTGEQENREQNTRLREELAGYPLFEGEGKAADSDWKPEPSFLVLGIPRTAAIETGRKYRQLAIVCGSIGGPAELLLLE